MTYLRNHFTLKEDSVCVTNLLANLYCVTPTVRLATSNRQDERAYLIQHLLSVISPIYMKYHGCFKNYILMENFMFFTFKLRKL